MKQSFRDRLAYARWLAYLRTGQAPGNADIAGAVDRTGPWVTKWAVSESPPRDYEVHAPMAAYFGVDERWLFRGEGNPPEPQLWAAWLANADARAAFERDSDEKKRAATRSGAPQLDFQKPQRAVIPRTSKGKK